MSRFADPRVTRRLELGPCECPGTPHSSDWVEFRTQISSADLARVARADETDLESMALAVVDFVVGWNLLGPDGENVPISGATFLALQVDTLSQIVTGVVEVFTVDKATAPNPSSAPSAASSQGSASPTRQPSRKRTT